MFCLDNAIEDEFETEKERRVCRLNRNDGTHVTTHTCKQKEIKSVLFTSLPVDIDLGHVLFLIG